MSLPLVFLTANTHSQWVWLFGNMWWMYGEVYDWKHRDQSDDFHFLFDEHQNDTQKILLVGGGTWLIKLEKGLSSNTPRACVCVCVGGGGEGGGWGRTTSLFQRSS